MVTITKPIRDYLHDGLVTIKANKHFPQHCHVECKHINTDTKHCNLQVKPVKLSEYHIRTGYCRKHFGFIDNKHKRVVVTCENCGKEVSPYENYGSYCYECALFERLEEIEIYKAALKKYGHEDPEELLDP